MGNTLDKNFKPFQHEFGDPPVVGNKVAVKPENPDIDFYTVWLGKDDENVLKRMFTISKWTGMVASMLVTCDTVLLDKTAGVYVAQQVLHRGIPWVGGGIVYVATVSAAASIRKKDGLMNHVIGGYMTGAFLATRASSPSAKWLTALGAGTMIAFVGSIYKEFSMNGWRVFPDVRTMDPAVRFGFSQQRWDTYDHENRDRPFNWVAAPKE